MLISARWRRVVIFILADFTRHSTRGESLLHNQWRWYVRLFRQKVTSGMHQLATRVMWLLQRGTESESEPQSTCNLPSTLASIRAEHDMDWLAYLSHSTAPFQPSIQLCRNLPSTRMHRLNTMSPQWPLRATLYRARACLIGSGLYDTYQPCNFTIRPLGTSRR